MYLKHIGVQEMVDFPITILGGELHGDGSRVRSAELSAEVCVRWRVLQSWCLPGGGSRNRALGRGEGQRQGVNG